MEKQAIQGVCIDLGDTLIDNSAFNKDKWFRAETKFFAEKGKKISLKQYKKDFHKILQEEIGKKNTRIHEFGFILKKISKEYNIKASKREIEEFDKNKWLKITEECNLFPDTIEALTKLKNANKKIFLITNTYKPKVDYILENKKINKFFDLVVISHEIKQPKSTGELFKVILEKFNLNPSQLIVVGDKFEEDIIGAKKAGIRSFLLNRNGQGDIKNLTEILPLVGIKQK